MSEGPNLNLGVQTGQNPAVEPAKLTHDLAADLKDVVKKGIESTANSIRTASSALMVGAVLLGVGGILVACGLFVHLAGPVLDRMVASKPKDNRPRDDEN